MKTIEELYNEVIASEEMKKEFLSLKPEEVEGFAEKYGCKATLEEIKAYITERNTASGDLSDDELDQIAGGKGADPVEAICSICTLGIACAAMVLDSLFDDNRSVGTGIKEDKMICGH